MNNKQKLSYYMKKTNPFCKNHFVRFDNPKYKKIISDLLFTIEIENKIKQLKGGK